LNVITRVKAAAAVHSLVQSLTPRSDKAGKKQIAQFKYFDTQNTPPLRFIPERKRENLNNHDDDDDGGRVSKSDEQLLINKINKVGAASAEFFSARPREVWRIIVSVCFEPEPWYYTFQIGLHQQCY